MWTRSVVRISTSFWRKKDACRQQIQEKKIVKLGWPISSIVRETKIILAVPCYAKANGPDSVKFYNLLI